MWHHQHKHILTAWLCSRHIRQRALVVFKASGIETSTERTMWLLVMFGNTHWVTGVIRNTRQTHTSSDSQLSRRESAGGARWEQLLINDQISSRSIKRSEEVEAGTIRIWIWMIHADFTRRGGTKIASSAVAFALLWWGIDLVWSDWFIRLKVARMALAWTRLLALGKRRFIQSIIPVWLK